MVDSEQEIPTEIELTQEHYERVCIEGDRIVLQLTEAAAQSLHDAGYSGGWHDV